MKKFFAMILSAAIFMTSAVTFAAPSDNDNYRGGGYGCYGCGCWR